MRFLIKLFILGFVALTALPAFVSDDVRLATRTVPASEETSDVTADTASVIAFAAGFVDDVSELCTRQPGVCAEGARLLEGIVDRAGHGLRVALVMIEQRRDADRQKAETPATAL